jgi:hypothetical protein
MMRRSPTLEGFRAVLRVPVLGLAEITWRWSVGTLAAALLGFAFFEYLDTLPISPAELLLLRSRHPFLISQAAAHILRGSALRLVLAGILVFTGISIAWIVAASVGRAAILSALLECFGASERSSPRGQLRSLWGLNFFRVAATLAAAPAALVGAALLAGFASSASDPHPALIFLLLVPLVCLVTVFWSILNWVLSLAAIFAMRDGDDTFAAVSAAVATYRECTGPMLAVGFWFGLVHVIAFMLATAVVAFPLAFAGVLPFAVVVGGVLLVTLLYFAVVDFLYVGRLAGYIAILELPENAKASSMTAPPLPEGSRATDRSPKGLMFPWSGIPASEDDILSDIKGLPPPEPSRG